MEFPPIMQSHIESGIRYKAPKRRPLYQQIGPDNFVINGFYKDGFTLAFDAANWLMEKIEAHN